MNTRTKLTKIGVGFAVGVLTALAALFIGWSWVWISVALGLVLTVFCLCRRNDKANRVLSCFLVACMAANPRLVAEDWYSGYNGGSQCYCPAAETPKVEQHVCILDFIVEPDVTGEMSTRITSVRHPDVSTLVDFDGMNESLAAWGISLDGWMQYSKNGQPATAAQTPFVFGDFSAPLAIFPEKEQYMVVVEVASELGTGFTMWQPLGHFSVPAGVPIQVQDSPDGPQTFYRVRLEQVPEDFQAAGPVLLGCGLGLLVGSAVVCVLFVRACARNKKKFEAMKPPPRTNDVNNPQQ